MKRPEFIFLALLILLFSCTKNQKQQQSPSAAATLNVTLNGIDKATALKEIQYFQGQRFNDPKPMSTSIWFDRWMIGNMVSLLQSEGADGISIYFVSDPSGGIPLKNSIVLVSTRANGADPDVPSGNRHVDYYDHASAAALFGNVQGINGMVTYGKADGGMLLYKTSHAEQLENVPASANRHQLSRQAAEQMVQGFGSHPIATNSEWFDLGLFQSFAGDRNTDGHRIYFATKTAAMEQAGSAAFVLIKTIAGTAPGTHVDYFGAPGVERYKLADGGQDNGELCPNYCN